MKDKIIQIAIKGGFIYGLSEEGNLYQTEGFQWNFFTQSPIPMKCKEEKDIATLLEENKQLKQKIREMEENQE